MMFENTSATTPTSRTHTPMRIDNDRRFSGDSALCSDGGV